MAAACSRDLGHLEVAIRNQYNNALAQQYPGWLWSARPSRAAPPNNALFDDGSYRVPRNSQQKLNKLNDKALNSLHFAREKAGVPRTQHSPASGIPEGKIIANLTFGFWTFLTEPVRASILWNQAISSVVPGRSRGWMHDRMENLNNLRNRVAHMEPLIGNTSALPQNLERIEDVLQMVVQPDVYSWISATSQVPALLQEGKRLGVLRLLKPTYLNQSLTFRVPRTSWPHGPSSPLRRRNASRLPLK